MHLQNHQLLHPILLHAVLGSDGADAGDASIVYCNVHPAVCSFFFLVLHSFVKFHELLAHECGCIL